MEVAILGFALGVLVCQMQASLLPLVWLLGPMPALGLLAWKTRGVLRLPCLVCLGFLLGFALADGRAQSRLDERLAESLEGQDVELTGRVLDLPQAFDGGLRFFFLPDSPGRLSSRLLINWYGRAGGGGASPKGGERWRLNVRLKRPHGNRNPHGFDYEAWLFERGVGATAYVRAKAGNAYLGSAPGLSAWLDRAREGVRARFSRALPDSPWRGVLIALAVGDQGSIPRDQWRLFARTGVTHLMSISGLHVTMVGALAGWLLSFLWRRCAWLALRLPAQKAGALGACFAAGGYVLLAGCGVPAQRTFYMFATAALSLFFGLGSAVRRTLALALLIVLIIDPWAVLSAGFWLSFIAVAALLAACRLAPRAGGWQAWWRAQWAVSLLTLPVLLGLFQQFSLVSPLANAIAIPVVSFIVTPLALLFSVLPLRFIAEFADSVLGALMQGLAWLSAWPIATWQQAAPPWWLVTLACLGLGWSLMPAGVPARRSALLCALALLAWTPPRPALGQAWVRMLDVGQGLAVHVQTATHDLLFDAGPRYSGESDAGERVVLPYLRAEGIGRLDLLVLSHEDKDHVGGAEAILAGLPVREIRSSQASLQNLGVSNRPCVRGEQWVWDSVSFEFLHPPADWPVRGDNDASCVLRLGSAGAFLLLTGDIGRRAEQALIASEASRLRSELIVAPHHGSKTSSGPAFVATVSPAEVLFSSGYRNRFHHPDEAVLERYRAAGARLWRSDRDGAVSVLLGPQAYFGMSAERARKAHYWREWKNND